MRLGRRLAKVLFWGLVLIVLITAGAAWFAYALVTDSETAERLIKARAARFLPRSIVEMGRINIGILKGEVTVSHFHVLQRIDGQSFLTARVPWLSVRLDPRQVLHGRFAPREVVLSQPTLRLCRRSDGTWNIQGLIADPWPGPTIKNPPPIVIRNGTIELVGDVDAEDDAVGLPVPALRLARVRELDRDNEVVRARNSTLRLRGDAAIAEAPPAVRQGIATQTARESTPTKSQSPGPAGSFPHQGVAILRDVWLRIEAGEGGRLRFEGSAHGDLFEKLTLEGSIDPITGDTVLRGELTGLTLSENLRRRLPPEIRSPFESLGLNRGEIDLELRRLAFHPGTPQDHRFEYDVLARLHGGVWECPSLPFPVNDLSAFVAISNGLISIKHAEGSNGNTILRAKGSLAPGQAATCLFDLRLDLVQLELDKRLQERTPAQFAELWDVFKPRGLVDAYIHLARQRENGPVNVGATVLCRDVAAVYRHFPYPVEHMGGSLTLENQRLSVDLHGLIGERPALLKGTIDNPGPDALVRLDIQADSVPIDAAFLAALPKDVRKVVDQFHPAGSVKGKVRILRWPMVGPRAKPEGHLVIDAALDLNPRCEITWAGLPYPIRNLTGRLELHPDLWEFKNMRGGNGQAIIMGNGRVQKLVRTNLPNGEPPLKIDLQIQAQDLPFNEDLRKALQPARQKTWSIINPTGASDVEATIHVEPGRPDINHISIVPLRDSSVRLVVHRTPQPGFDPGGTFELRMENVHGRFDFDNGKVVMNDVNFLFHGAPVQFASGDVMVEDSGRFALAVSELWVKEIRLDSSLRTIMPPLMAQFALRLDDGRPFTARGNLQIGWSGQDGEPAWCRWDNTRVVFIDNTLEAGIPLKHIQGQLEEVRGWSNGQTMEIHGIVSLDSITLLGQQITDIESPFHLERGSARLDSLRGKLLRGDLEGSGTISLDATPKYSAALRLAGAQLEEYARTLPGRQSYRGALGAAIDLSGLGNNVRSIQGKGEAHITQGDLGELPVALRFINFLNSNLSLLDSPRTSGKTAFDSADVAFRIDHGTAILDPIKLTGSAVSLQGSGNRDPLGNLDIQLRVLYGRDRLHLPIVSDLMREASGQFLIVHVLGPSSDPRFKLETLPQVRKLGTRRGQRDLD
ncbi:MAG: AsmA-like C-terminal region-containing protein [Isosphaeraceae bacterium]